MAMAIGSAASKAARDWRASVLDNVIDLVFQHLPTATIAAVDYHIAII